MIEKTGNAKAKGNRAVVAPYAGYAEYIAQQGLKTQIVAVDARGSVRTYATKTCHCDRNAV